MVALREVETSDFPGAPGHTARGACRFHGPCPGAGDPEEQTMSETTTTQAGAATAEALIAERRLRIDDLDARIIALVQERMSVSGQIQAARIGSGGRRVHLARELEVLRTYGAALGKPGTAVAMKLLELCRGGGPRDEGGPRTR